jgi:uncharacterized metal-binding protein YceD (DUF177 family)
MSRRIESEPEAVPPEFPRPINVEAMAGHGTARDIAASPDECQALAERFRLLAIDRLNASVRVRRLESGRLVRVSGHLTADVVQSCVVTLEPVPAHIEQPFAALFTDDPALLDDGGEVVIDPLADEEDLPEPIVGGMIDIGELTAQHLSLALDPYPRCHDAAFAGLDDDRDHPESARGTPNPFQALAALKRRD